MPLEDLEHRKTSREQARTCSPDRIDALVEKRPAESRSWVAAEGPFAAVRPYVPLAEQAPRADYAFSPGEGHGWGITLTAEPMIDLGRAEIVAFYVRDQVRDRNRSATLEAPRLEALDDDAFERFERLRFRRGLALLEEQGPGWGVLPVSWRMVTEFEPGFVAQNAAVRARVDPRERLVAELTDIPAGVERLMLRKVVSRLAQRRRAVFLRVPAESEALAAIAGSGARGVCLDTGGVNVGDQRKWKAFEVLVRAARIVAPLVLLDHAPAWRWEEAWSAGATHVVSGRFPRLDA